MHHTPYYAHVLPDDRQVLLLKSALSPLPEATAAWDEWKRSRPPGSISKRTDLIQHIRSGMDRCSQRLLPLVFRNLEPAGDLIAMLFKNSCLQTRQRNLQLLDTTKHIIRALEQHGYEALLLKGLPLTFSYYNDPGVRSSADLDFLVRGHQFREVCTFLKQKLQLIPEVDGSSFFFSGVYHVMHSQVFRGCPFEIDVHHSLFHEHLQDEKTALFWQDRESVMLDSDFRVHTLSPTHLLFHVLAHARDPRPAIRWVADAVMICRKDSHRIDWETLLTLAGRYRFTSLFRLMLPFLAHHFSVPVPGGILEQLQQMPEPLYEKRYFFINQQTPRNPLVKAYYFFYRDWLQQRMYRERPLSFFSYIGRQKYRLIYRLWESVKRE